MKEKTIEQRLYHSYTLGCIIVILISLSVTLYYSLNWQRQSLDDTITSMAAVVADMPMVVSALEEGGGSEELTAYLDMILEVTDRLDIVTVCDKESRRIYHPEKERIGERFIGDDEGPILEGEAPYITEGMGTLGYQRRAFQAVRDQDGTIIGFVMASVLTESIRQMRNQILLIYGIVGLMLLGVGAGLARHNMNYLKRLLMGYQPEEFITKYVERSEVLDALDEGIFAVNPKGEVILMNQSARTMLGLERGRTVEGEPLKDLYPKTRLLETMRTGQPEYNVNMVLNGNHIVSNRIPIWENNRIAGAISIFRDRTEVLKMAEELTGARDMLDTLRAFNHEFMNKLHVILGYLQLGETDTAMEYISNTTLLSSQAVKEVSAQITVSHLSALIIGKMMRANEMGIHLALKNGSHCARENLMFPVDVYVTIIGNLLENAMEELNAHDYPVKDVELGLYCEYDCTVITCEDTGGGIPEEMREQVFLRGVSTKGKGRGTGLPLIKDLADRYHGEITVDTEAGEGTCITVSFTRTEEEETDVSCDDCGG